MRLPRSLPSPLRRFLPCPSGLRLALVQVLRLPLRHGAATKCEGLLSTPGLIGPGVLVDSPHPGFTGIRHFLQSFQGLGKTCIDLWGQREW